MKKQKSRLFAKLKSNAGESLGEVLIALLIAALAMTMLASVISSASRILTNSHKAIDEYYEANDVIANQTADPSKTMSIKLTLKSPGSGQGSYPAGEVFLNGGDLSTGLKVQVGLYVNDKAGNDKKVVSYKKVR